MGRMKQRRAFVLALITTATVATATACGSKPATNASPTQPTSTQTVTTTGPAAPQEFVSKRYAFSVTLPRDWSESDAQVDWDGKMLQGIGSPAFANFADATTGRTLVAAAAPVAKGTRLAEWRAAMVRAAPSFCSESSSVEKTTLGGEPALAWTDACSDGYNVDKLTALHGKRGYMIFLPSPTTNDEAADRRVFESIRRSFRFTR